MIQMINLNEKIKTVAKIAGIIFLFFFLYGLFSLLSGGNGKQQSSGLPVGIEMEEPPMETFMMQPHYENSGAVKMEGNVPSDRPVVDDDFLERKVVKNGNLSLKVRSIEDAANEIGTIATGEGGEVFSTNFYEGIKGQKNGYVTVKVPVSRFDDVMKKIKQVATQVVSESTTGQDVTNQYSDLQTQLRNKKAEEESFVKILDRAGKIEDVLATTRELSRVRGEIERLEGRIKSMDSQTEMSTITVNLTEDVEVSSIGEDWRIGQVFKEAFNDLKKSFQSFVNGIIRFIVVGIPSLIPFALLVWLMFWIGKIIAKKISK